MVYSASATLIETNMHDDTPLIYSEAIDSDGKHYVKGPGKGLSYHGGTLYPETRFERQEDAEKAAGIANTSHSEGYKQAQRDMRKAMGLE